MRFIDLVHCPSCGRLTDSKNIIPLWNSKTSTWDKHVCQLCTAEGIPPVSCAPIFPRPPSGMGQKPTSGAIPAEAIPTWCESRQRT